MQIKIKRFSKIIILLIVFIGILFAESKMDSYFYTLYYKLGVPFNNVVLIIYTFIPIAVLSVLLTKFINNKDLRILSIIILSITYLILSNVKDEIKLEKEFNTQEVLRTYAILYRKYQYQGAPEIDISYRNQNNNTSKRFKFINKNDFIKLSVGDTILIEILVSNGATQVINLYPTSKEIKEAKKSYEKYIKLKNK